MGSLTGAVAAGHPCTAEAASTILRAGGIAVDASLAALLTACVVEPVLASLGGGGFLLASPARGAPLLYDFFTQTPRRRRRPDEVEFREVFADFGTVRQAFHVGLGSAATPGLVRGVFSAHAELGRIPVREIFAPAIDHARTGTEVRTFDAYVMEVCGAIFRSTPECAAIYASPSRPERLVAAGDRMRLPGLADVLEALSREGPDLFYRGEIAARIAHDMDTGGQLTRADLEHYRVHRRAPLAFRLGTWELRGNPPPSAGGVLLAFALELLRELPHTASEGEEHLRALARTMALTGEARLAAGREGGLDAGMLHDGFLTLYRQRIQGRSRATRGTTHVSVLDGDGGAASLSVSNGEGCGYVVPGTGIVLNNMLGEEDVNPGGLQRWREDERMTSMMSPIVGRTGAGHTLCLGSGGSNRIRSALLQVLVNVVEKGLDALEAVHRPRIHLEPSAEGSGRLSIEGGLDPQALPALLEEYPEHEIWNDLNMFFGGVHTVLWDGDRVQAAGDPRRGGTEVVHGS